MAGLTARVSNVEREHGRGRGPRQRCEQRAAAAAEPAGADEGYSGRRLAAYEQVAATMAPEDFADVHARLVERLSARRSEWGAPDDFLTARVLSLADRATDGIPAALLKPPALAAAWREHDARHAGRVEGARARFDSQSCAECGAEHPWPGRYEHNEAQRRNVLANPEECFRTCLGRGGVASLLGQVWCRASAGPRPAFNQTAGQ